MPVNGEADEPGWKVDPDGEWGVAVLTTVGKLGPDAVGMRAGGFQVAVGYRERVPRREYPEKADKVLRTGGLTAERSRTAATACGRSCAGNSDPSWRSGEWDTCGSRRHRRLAATINCSGRHEP